MSSRIKAYLIENKECVFFLSVILIFFSLQFNKAEVFDSDAKLYYSYLPELIIDKKLGPYIKYPIGVALLEFPFFICAHIISFLISADSTGYTLIYEKAAFMSACFYYLLGTVSIYNVIKKIFNKYVGLMVALVLTFGTMLPYYVTNHPLFSHIYSYAICSFSFWYIIFYESKKENCNNIYLNLVLGILAGLIIMLRNINILFCLTCFLYKVDSLKALKDRFRSIIIPAKILWNILGMSLICIPQMWYQLIQKGSIFINTYSGEAFNYLKRPKIVELLFSNAKGLFIFSPILFICLLGLIYGKKIKAYRVLVITILIIFIYINSSWWCWWFGGSYGQRVFCDYLCLFALPLGSLLYGVFYEDLGQKQNKVIQLSKIVIISFVIISVILNLLWMQGVKEKLISNNLASWFELNTYFRNSIFWPLD